MEQPLPQHSQPGGAGPSPGFQSSGELLGSAERSSSAGRDVPTGQGCWHVQVMLGVMPLLCPLTGWVRRGTSLHRKQNWEQEGKSWIILVSSPPPGTALLLHHLPTAELCLVLPGWS